MEPCPGCGAAFPSGGLPPAPRLNASHACLAAYHALTLSTLGLNDAEFVHQHAVDVYAAQHAGGPSRPVTTFFALAGLQLALEEGLTGRQVQAAHVRMARSGKDWPTFTPPATPGRITILAIDDPRKDLLPWMIDAWASWSFEHARVRATTRRALG